MRARAAGAMTLIFLCVGLLSGGIRLARSEDLVVALSTREVAITSTYTGAEISLFGLIERDARTIARSGTYDVVASVQGPRGEILLQRKDQFGPLWLTDLRRRFVQMPLFFSLLSGRPLAEVADDETRARLKLGLEHYLPPPDRAAPEREETDIAFRNALLRLQGEQGHLTWDEKSVTMIRPNLFSARITLPATAPVGLYVVNVSLLSEGVPLKTAQAGFVVRKVGFDAFVANSAQNNSAVYGLFTILMAVFLGWLANIIFRRD
jgi:uncharacterized protein (TIGR02186 family)